MRTARIFSRWRTAGGGWKSTGRSRRARTYAVRLEVTGEDRRGLYADVMQAISQTGTNIRGADLNSRDGSVHGLIFVEVDNLTHLAKVLRTIRKVKGIITVDRREVAAEKAAIGVSSGMVNSWLLKTDPPPYAWTDLQRDCETVCEGAPSAAALTHLRATRAGDAALIYHSGDRSARSWGSRKIVTWPVSRPQAGRSEAGSGRCPARCAPLEAARDARFEIKAEKALATLALVRISPAVLHARERRASRGCALRTLGVR